MTDINTTATENTKNLSAIEEALAKAKAKRIAKPVKPAPEPKAEKPKREKTAPKTDAEKAAELQAKESEKELKKAAREAAKAEKAAADAVKKAEKETAKAAKKAAKAGEEKVPHLKKVEEAASFLPDLTDSTVNLVAAFDSLTATEVSIALAHIEHSLRQRQTLASTKVTDIDAGDLVEILSGPAEYIGERGRVVKAQRIRCFVELAGVNKPVYLFTADVRKVESAEATEAETDAEVTEITDVEVLDEAVNG